MQSPHDAQEPFEDLLASSCDHQDRFDTVLVDSVLEQIESAVNLRSNQQEPSSKKSYEDEQVTKLCAFFARLQPKTQEDFLAEHNRALISSSELLLPAPVRFSRKLRKACASALPK